MPFRNTSSTWTYVQLFRETPRWPTTSDDPIPLCWNMRLIFSRCLSRISRAPTWLVVLSKMIPCGFLVSYNASKQLTISRNVCAPTGQTVQGVQDIEMVASMWVGVVVRVLKLCGHWRESQGSKWVSRLDGGGFTYHWSLKVITYYLGAVLIDFGTILFSFYFSFWCNLLFALHTEHPKWLPSLFSGTDNSCGSTSIWRWNG